MPNETFGTTFGCLLVSFMLDLILYGVGLLLVLQYFRKSSHDALLVKVTVLVLGIFATMHTTSFCAWIYKIFISNFSHPERLNELPQAVYVVLMAFYIVSFIAQCFYISQIWNVSNHNIWIASPLLVLALINIGAGIAQTVTTAQRATESGLDDEINKIITTLETGAAALCDVLVTIALCVFLRIDRTGIKSTDSALAFIVAINRGAVTSLAAVLNLILYLSRPKSLLFFLPLSPSTQLYVISVVGSLNYREHIRQSSRHRNKDWNGVNMTANDSYSVPLERIGPSDHSSPDGIQVLKSVVTWKGTETETVADSYAAC